MKPAVRDAFSSHPASPLGDTADPGLPAPQGLYDPRLDKDSCGVGFIADIKGRKSHQLVEDALSILCNLEHRGAVGADPRAGDGAGILCRSRTRFFHKEAGEDRLPLPQSGRIRDRRSCSCRPIRTGGGHPRHLCPDDHGARA